jgi:phenylacetate-CoA ligase
MNRLTDFVKYKFRHNFLLEKHINQVSSYYNLPAQELHDLKLKKVTVLIRQARNKSYFYRNLYHNLSTEISNIQSTDDLHALPIIDKQLIRHKVNKVLIGSRLTVRKTETTGTTGSPLKIYRDYKSIMRENAYLWYYRMRNGLNPGDPVISFRMDVSQENIQTFNKASNTLYLSSYKIFDENIETYVRAIEKFKPKAMLTYPSTAHILATALEKRGISFNIPATFTSSETLYDYQREKIESIFNTKIFDWYGNAERSIALEQCAYGNYHEVPLYSVNEYHENYVITTGLIGPRFPLIRYIVEDIIIPDSNNSCNCGLGHPVIKRIAGRTDDYITLNDGTTIPSIDFVLKGVKGIINGQMVQDEPGIINMNLVTNQKFNEDAKQLLKRNILEITDNRVEVVFNFIEAHEIIRSKSGKFKFTINNYIKNSHPVE